MDSTPVLVDCNPPMRSAGSNVPRISISGPKISAMELRYSAWVSRLRLTTSELAALAAGLPAARPAENTTVDSNNAARLRIRSPAEPEYRSTSQLSAKALRTGDFYRFLTRRFQTANPRS